MFVLFQSKPPLTKEKRICHTKLFRNHVIDFEVKYNFGTFSPLFGKRIPKYIYLTLMTKERYRSLHAMADAFFFR